MIHAHQMTPNLVTLVVLALAFAGFACGEDERTVQFSGDQLGRFGRVTDDGPADAGSPNAPDSSREDQDSGRSVDEFVPDAAPDAGSLEQDVEAPDRGPDLSADLGTDSALDLSVDPPDNLDAESETGAILVAVISDLNGSYGSTEYQNSVHNAVSQLLDLQPDLVLSTGDMVAGQQAGLDYRAMWDAFHVAVSDELAFANIPFAVTPGNHDASAYSGFVAERSIFVDEWSTRWPQVDFLDDDDYPLRYSFTMGDALFISIDSTTVGRLSADQMSWIEDQLVDGAEYSVKIVFAHVPLYPFTQDRETDIIGDPDLEDLLNDYGVTLFLSGHHHAYYPGRRGELRLVSTACLGGGRRRLIGDDATSAHSILLFEVSDGQLLGLDAFDGTTFNRIIERTSLPEAVGGGSTQIWRDDL